MAISGKLPFALYKFPGNKEIKFITQRSCQVRTIDNIGDVFKQNGFIISPFDNHSPKTKTFLIRPDVYIEGINDIYDFVSNNFPENVTCNNCFSERKIDSYNEEGFELYEKNFNVFHNALINKSFDKLVLSRAMEIERNENFSVIQIFERAVEKYPGAFIYLLNTSQTGTWFGCSPEVLLSGRNSEWRTAALAGTRKTGCENPDWDSKNIEEQRIVVDYIKKQLENLQISFNQGESHNIRAGNIEHYKVDFTFSLDSQEKAGLLLKALHPTPAVGGYPQNEAIKFITENETHDRLYYSGFVGAVNISHSTDLFVNIRCMQVLNNTLRLYAGGGLTASSNLNDEWLETHYKLQTLLSLL